MSVSLYYTAPAQDVFDEIKAAALTIWRGHSNELYIKEKVERIESILNVSDNWMYMVAMFDTPNKLRLFGMLRTTTVHLIIEAMS